MICMKQKLLSVQLIKKKYNIIECKKKKMTKSNTTKMKLLNCILKFNLILNNTL